MKYSELLKHFSESNPCPVTESEFDLLLRFMPIQMILDVALRAPHCKQVSFPRRGLTTKDVVALLKLLVGNPYVHTLDLSYNFLIDEIPVAMLNQIPNLRNLNLEYCKFLDDNTIEMLTTCSSITNLNLSNIRSIRNNIATALLRQSTLTNLSINVLEDSSGDFSRALGSNTTLKSISLTLLCCGKGDTARNIQNNTTLQDMTFFLPDDRINITDDRYNVYKAIIGMPFKSLSIQGMGDPTFLKVAEMPLQHLYAQNKSRPHVITSKSVQMVAKLNNLLTLDVTGTYLEMEAFKALSAATNLRKLVIDDTLDYAYIEGQAAQERTSARVASLFSNSHWLQSISFNVFHLTPKGAWPLTQLKLRELALDTTNWYLNEDDARQTLSDCVAKSLTIKLAFLQGSCNFFRSVSSNTHIKHLVIDHEDDIRSNPSSYFPFFREMKHLKSFNNGVNFDLELETNIYENHYRGRMVEILIALAPLVRTTPNLQLFIILNFVFKNRLEGYTDGMIIAGVKNSLAKLDTGRQVCHP